QPGPLPTPHAGSHSGPSLLSARGVPLLAGRARRGGYECPDTPAISLDLARSILPMLASSDPHFFVASFPWFRAKRSPQHPRADALHLIIFARKTRPIERVTQDTHVGRASVHQRVTVAFQRGPRPQMQRNL